MGYLSPFWVLRVISTIDESRCACTCWSLNLVVLADSGLFHGLLMTVPWAIKYCCGSPELIPPLTNPRVHLRAGHQHLQFWPILTCFMGYYSSFHGLLFTVLGPRSDFHH